MVFTIRLEAGREARDGPNLSVGISCPAAQQVHDRPYGGFFKGVRGHPRLNPPGGVVGCATPMISMWLVYPIHSNLNMEIQER